MACTTAVRRRSDVGPGQQRRHHPSGRRISSVLGCMGGERFDISQKTDYLRAGQAWRTV
jgi:hypothetical protein